MQTALLFHFHCFLQLNSVPQLRPLKLASQHEMKEQEADLNVDTEEVNPDEAEAPTESSVRDLYIKAKDVKKYGSTRGCKACEQIMTGKV